MVVLMKGPGYVLNKTMDVLLSGTDLELSCLPWRARSAEFSSMMFRPFDSNVVVCFYSLFTRL